MFKVMDNMPKAGIFLGLIWGRNLPFQFKNERKLPNMLYIILSSTFW